MDQLQAIMDNYKKLCDYCDDIWKRVRKAYPDEIACRDGCDTCCELQSVNQLEAHAIRSHMQSANNKKILREDDTVKSSCPFLSDNSCTIYAARPIICRTHGLILRSTEFAGTYQAGSCPYNFPSHHPQDFPPEMTADTDAITKNLTKLNLAFCMVSGIDASDEARSRVPLRELAAVWG